uniref:phosphoinositide 5-phosphatase n=1 Tax=Cyprinus carpio TaxID=7962 RepID=A0A8C1TAZ9_CYPCA
MHVQTEHTGLQRDRKISWSTWYSMRMMQGVFLQVFSKFCHLPFLRGIQTQSTRTGLGGYWGNKGGISERMIQRMENFESILQQQQFEGSMAVGVLDHDVVFWFGDLNFRIEGYDIHVVKSNTSSFCFVFELNMVKKTEPVLEGFMEGPLNFPPTYKFDVETHTYDTSAKKRKPTWTDRILWVSAGRAPPYRPITLHYSSHMGFTLSDHKPVSALFCLHVSLKMVNVPLVTLEVEKEWTKFSDATVKLTVVGLYKPFLFKEINLYITYSYLCIFSS